MPVSINMQSRDIVRFSPCGSRVSVCSSDGRLGIWKVGGAGAAPEQQWVPSNHLEATTACLAWQPIPCSSTKKRKKKKDVGDEEQRPGGSDLQALGTSAGTVVIYSVKQGDLVTSIKKENNSKINAITWTNNGSYIYAAAEDGSVSQFSLSKMAHISSFSVSPGSPLHSVCVSPCDGFLAAASHTIGLFSLTDSATPKLLTTLSGHANPVTCLAFTGSGGMLASAAQEERTVQLWDTSSTGPSSGCQLSLACNEGVRSLGATDGGVTVVTEGGVVLVFRPPQSSTPSKKKKPLKPSNKLVISSSKDPVSGKVLPIPVLAARLEGSHDLGLAYGSAVRPVIEKVQLSELKESESIVRDLPLVKVAQGHTQEFNKVITPKTDGDVTFLAPGVSQPVVTGKLGKRKQSVAPPPSQDSLPMEERVSLLGSQETGQDIKDTPLRTDTLAQLLTQGLHSGDPRILNSVLDRADPELIDNTVRLLPAEAVVPLVTSLQNFIKGRGIFNASHAKWLKSVLAIHTGYLVSIPDCQDLLSPVYALLERRTSHYSQVLQLKGKLELLTKQTDSKEGDKIIDTNKEALLVYQDDSSDELENVIDDLLVPGSGSEDQWTDEEENDKEMEADEESDSDVEIVNGDGESDEEMESDD